MNTFAEFGLKRDVISINPCVKAFGLGPAETTCKTCRFLIAKSYAKTYYKCEKRKTTNSQWTDHRVSWPACGKYEVRLLGPRIIARVTKEPASLREICLILLFDIVLLIILVRVVQVVGR